MQCQCCALMAATAAAMLNSAQRCGSGTAAAETWFISSLLFSSSSEFQETPSLWYPLFSPNRLRHQLMNFSFFSPSYRCFFLKKVSIQKLECENFKSLRIYHELKFIIQFSFYWYTFFNRNDDFTDIV